MAKETATERADRLEGMAVEVWQKLQDADGSRGGMQTAIDDAQDLIEQEISDVADQAAELDDSDDGNSDDDDNESDEDHS
jgi:hypothetical protein